jgi:hypothetical protein
MTDIEHALSITGGAYCGGCGQDWPCQHERLREENARLRAALELVMTEALSSFHGGIPVGHDPRSTGQAVRMLTDVKRLLGARPK